MIRFKTVVLDVDSTVTGIEGIDWLAGRRGTGVVAEVAALTRAAMEGKIELDSVYGRRLSLVRPTRADLDALGKEYVEKAEPDAKAVIADLSAGGVAIHLMSGGLLPAVKRLARALRVPLANVHAVDAYFDDEGAYAGYDERSPLTRQTGKRALVESLKLESPVLMVGDGATDVEAAPAVQCFVAFTGFASRPEVTGRANHVISRLSELRGLVLT